jgi:hypothetical protein
LTINEADELPGERDEPSYLRALPEEPLQQVAHAPSEEPTVTQPTVDHAASADEIAAATAKMLGLPGIDPGERFKVRDQEASKHPDGAAQQSSAAAPAEDTWGDAAASLVYRGLCVLTGGFLGGAGLMFGGWAALKLLPWLEAVLSGNSG